MRDYNTCNFFAIHGKLNCGISGFRHDEKVWFVPTISAMKLLLDNQFKDYVTAAQFTNPLRKLARDRRIARTINKIGSVAL